MAQVIGLFGGSFNPPHLGHAEAIRTVLRQGIDQVWLLPVMHHRGGKVLTDFDVRVELCRAFCEAFPGTVAVRTDEAQNPTGRTLDLVKSLSIQHPSSLFRLIMGQDVERHFDRWPGAADIRRIAPPFVVPRSSDSRFGALSSREIRARIAAGSPVETFLSKNMYYRIKSERLYRHE
ncbi:MAG: adenylyltransferase/cytidyltransferase family protein [Pseudomonadota bacterium]